MVRTFLIILVLSAFNFRLFGQKTDKVHLKNGDILTGEIKSLKFAKLSFDMTGPGLIQIKWEEITDLKSTKKLQITLKKGEVFVTSIDSLFIQNKEIKLEDIVEIVQIKDQFLKRLDGDANLGFNYAKSSDIAQFNFNGSLAFRKPRTELRLKVNSVLSRSSGDTILARKQDATLNLEKQYKHSYYYKTDLAWQQNTQLGLRNRVLLTGGGGKYILNDNHRRLLCGTGLSYNVEQSNLSEGFVTNLEGLATFQFKKFRYSTPKIAIDLLYTIYPGISNWGRIRMDFQVQTKIEIFKDLFVGLNFYELYDNRPPSGTQSKTDYGVNFTVGYEFGR